MFSSSSLYITVAAVAATITAAPTFTITTFMYQRLLMNIRFQVCHLNIITASPATTDATTITHASMYQ